MNPLLCIENIIPDLELPSFQNVGVYQALINKKMLLGFDTGTGKTITYAVFVRGLLNRNPEKKHIFVIIHDSIIQAPSDISSLAAVPVEVISGERGEAGRLSNLWERTSIFVMTYESFRNLNVVLFLYNHLTEIESVVVDEAHHCGNWDSSNTAFMIRALTRYISYVDGLSATPATRTNAQFYRIMNLIDRNLSSQRDESNYGAYLDRYLPVNRGDYDMKGDYITTSEIVTPMPHQVGNIKGDVFRVIKGPNAVNQVERLVKVVLDRKRKGQSVIVYVHLHCVREWVEQHFRDVGITFESLTGRVTKQAERQRMLDSFNNREVDVLITSVSESLNIDADVVVFYEFTTRIKQVMGRAHRGLAGKRLELVFIITRDTAEVDFFNKYIYKRSMSLQRLLKKDYSEFIKVGEQLKSLDIASDEESKSP